MHLKLSKCLFILTLFLLAIFVTACEDEDWIEIICSSEDKNLAMKAYCFFSGDKSSKDSDSDKNSDNETTDAKGECKYDSECPPICEGNTAYKRGCNPRVGKCEKLSEEVCDKVDDVGFGDYQFTAICKEGKCYTNIAAIQAKRTEIKQEATDLASFKPTLRSMMNKAQAICDGGAENVDFASMTIDSPTQEIQDCCMYASLYTLHNAQQTSNKDKFVQYNCNLALGLKDDIASIDKRIADINKASAEMYDYIKLIENS
jgi:hypothetical protein